jgi:hypothetical protein
MRTRLWSLCIPFFFAAAAGVAAQAGERPASQTAIWTGVYQTAQVERAKPTFMAVCRRCHNDDLGGSERGPSLRGDRFMANWETQGLNLLFAKIRDTMPPDSPSSLPDATYLDLMTLILQANGFPAGSDVLTPDKLSGILLVRKSADGSVQIPNFRLVEIVGCLTAGPGNTWFLTHSGDPMLTTDGPPATSALAGAATRPLGSQEFRLIGVRSFSPEGHAGQKMQAKGLMYRAPDKDRINLVSLEAVSPSCAP